MNYQKLHDAIISRANLRDYDSTIHHNHHIIPIHEDSESKETVPLTLKEHYIIHFIRYKITGTIGNKLAYCLLRNLSTKYTREEYLKICSDAGKIGGRATKDNNLGIFSPNYDRSSQSKLNWENGIGLAGIPLEKKIETGKKIGKSTKENNLGIFSPDYINYHREYWVRVNGSKGGIVCRDEKRGMFAISKEEKIENAKKYGKIGGKVVGSLPWWTNGTINKRSKTSPGSEWIPGMTKIPTSEWKVKSNG